MPDEGDVFDVIVIGAGPVGETAAARAVRNGLTAAVVERRLAGGECHYFGCIPSKAQAHAAGEDHDHQEHIT